MNALHFHLLITHLPLFASFLGAMVLVYGMMKASPATREAAFLMLILAGLGAILSNISGENAEHLAEKIAGISEENIEEHEESAGLVLWMMIPCGLSALAALIAGRFASVYEKGLSRLVLILALLAFAATARTAWLGGKIRHTEIQQAGE
jgi:hypothetical protein